MATEEIEAMFSDDDCDEYIKFENIPAERRLSTRPDIHAFILLNKLAPGTRDMICSSEHDEYFLEPSIDDLAKGGATEQDIMDLIRCGVRNGCYGLCMFA